MARIPFGGLLALGLAILPAAASAQFTEKTEYIACESGMAPAYSESGNTVYWLAVISSKEAQEKLGLPSEKVLSAVSSKFHEWIRETGQFGRWNSISPSKIDCDWMGREGFERLNRRYTAGERYVVAPPSSSAGEVIEFRIAKLPPHWFFRGPNDAAVKESASPRDSTGDSTGRSPLDPDAEARAVAKERERAIAAERSRADAEARARAEAQERARAEAERKSKAEVDALYAQQIKQTQDHLRAEQEKIDSFERQQRAADARAAAFERALANQRRIDAEYEASMARHRKCVAGDQTACEDIRQGAPLEVVESEGKASTDDDPTRCVASPVVSPSPAFRGQTQAVVVNGCDKPVDVRICLLREGGWNCGVNWGIRPQDKWTHTSFKAVGEVFWDARYSGTTKALGSPE